MSSIAIVGFVLSLVPFFSVPGLVLSIVALTRTGAQGHRGRGLAIAGVVAGVVNGLVTVAILAAIAIPVFLNQQELAQQQASMPGI